MSDELWEEFRQWCIVRDVPVDVHLVNHFWKWWRTHQWTEAVRG